MFDFCLPILAFEPWLHVRGARSISAPIRVLLAASVHCTGLLICSCYLPIRTIPCLCRLLCQVLFHLRAVGTVRNAQRGKPHLTSHATG